MGIMKSMFKKYLIPTEHNEYQPHFFKRKALAATSLFVLVVFGLSLGYSLLLNRTNFLAAVLPAVLIDEANSERAFYKLTPLTHNPKLEKAAREKAEDMASHGYFAHISPTGIAPWYWFTRAGYRFIYAGENLAIDFSDSKDVTRAWMNSSTNRVKILNVSFSEIGIATALGTYQGRTTTFVVEMFGRPIQVVAEVAPVKIIPGKESVTPIINNKEFIAVRNNAVATATELLARVAPQATTLGVTNYATAPSRILSNPKMLLDLVYLIILTLTLLAIILSLVIEIRRHHGRHLISGVFLIALVVGLSYCYEYITHLHLAIL